MENHAMGRGAHSKDRARGAGEHAPAETHVFTGGLMRGRPRTTGGGNRASTGGRAKRGGAGRRQARCVEALGRREG